MDLGLAAELGADRVHGQAVGFLPAVAAALADPLVDHHLRSRGRRLTAAALAALFRGALLVVDQHRHPGLAGQFGLHGQQVAAGADLNAAGQRAGPGPGEIVGRDDDLGHAFGQQQPDQAGQRLDADRLLPAGHRDRRVVQQLVGDVHPRRHGGPHRQAAGVEEGAVADVLHEMLAFGERGQADPLRALAAHLGQPDHLADLLGRQEHDHRVAADAAADQCVGAGLGRGVVRAAGAEVRGPGQQRQLDPVPARPGPPRLHRGDIEPVQGARQPGGHRVGVEFARGGEQDVASRIALTVYGRRRRPAVEDLLDGRLHERALLLDHDQLVEAVGELADDLGFGRPDHAELQQPDPAAAQGSFVQAEHGQRLAHVEVGLAGRDDADPVARRAAHDPVEAVEPGVLQGPGQPHAVQGSFQLRQVGAEQPGGRAVCAPPGLAGLGDDPAGIDLRRAGPVGYRRGDLQGAPQPGEPGQVMRVQPEVQHVLRIGRVQRGHGQVSQRALNRARHGGALRRGVIAGQRDRAAARVGTDEVGVAQRIGSPVQAGCLAVPDACHPVGAQPVDVPGELGTHHRGGGQLLVQGWPVHHVQVGQQAGPAGDLQVVAAERGSLVTRDERAAAQPADPVLPGPVEEHPHQALHARQIDGALFPQVTVGQRVVHQSSASSSASVASWLL